MNLQTCSNNIIPENVLGTLWARSRKRPSINYITIFYGFSKPFSHIQQFLYYLLSDFDQIFTPSSFPTSFMNGPLYHFFINVIDSRLSFYWKTYFLYSPSTVVFEYFSTSFMALTRSLMSLDSTLWAIST